MSPSHSFLPLKVFSEHLGFDHPFEATMAIAERLAMYRNLEQLRNHPVIVYVTSKRIGASASMSADAIPELLDQISAIPAEVKDIDLLVVSNGGDPTVAWRIMSLLRERFKRVSVLIPQGAFSAATLLALGADEIVIHPNGNLGPTDVQITGHRLKDNNPFAFGAEDLASFISFAREEVGITDQEHITRLFESFCSDVGAVGVGVAARGSRLSLSMGLKLLKMHMTGAEGENKARSIAEMTKDYFHHGYPVGRTEARSIGLKVAVENADVERFMAEIWRDIEVELRERTPFNVQFEVLANPAAAAILMGPSQQLAIPGNTPPALVQQLLQAWFNTQAVREIPPTDCTVIEALMESRFIASRNTSDYRVLAARSPDLQIKANGVRVRMGWINTPVA